MITKEWSALFILLEFCTTNAKNGNIEYFKEKRNAVLSFFMLYHFVNNFSCWVKNVYTYFCGNRKAATLASLTAWPHFSLMRQLCAKCVTKLKWIWNSLICAASFINILLKSSHYNFRNLRNKHKSGLLFLKTW